MIVDGDLCKVMIVYGDWCKVRIVDGDLCNVRVVDGDWCKVRVVDGDLCNVMVVVRVWCILRFVCQSFSVFGKPHNCRRTICRKWAMDATGACELFASVDAKAGVWNRVWEAWSNHIREEYPTDLHVQMNPGHSVEYGFMGR